MANKTIKIDEDVHDSVQQHTEKKGGKIGKFFEIAAKEKMERERLSEKVKYNEQGIKIERK